MVLKPHDVVILVKVHLLGHEPWTYESLGRMLRMSPSTVHQGLKTARAAGLYRHHKPDPPRSSGDRKRFGVVRDRGAKPYGSGSPERAELEKRFPGLVRSEHVVISGLLLEFLIHGVRYAYPAVRGGTVIGVPTAYGAPPLKGKFMVGSSVPIPVWPYPDGGVQGFALEPLHPAVPAIALEDPAFGEIMALVDAMRIGQVREKLAARELLKERIEG